MTAENMKYYDQLRTPPANALKTIKGGRLAGMSDISPQWRYEVLTTVFGPCGLGWKYEIVRIWNESGSEGQVFAFAEIHLSVKYGDVWSEAIPATGGSMLVELESRGLHSNDEGYKMAITDALGTAAKMVGVAADVYRNGAPQTKYDSPAVASAPSASTTHSAGVTHDTSASQEPPKAEDTKEYTINQTKRYFVWRGVPCTVCGRKEKDGKKMRVDRDTHTCYDCLKAGKVGAKAPAPAQDSEGPPVDAYVGNDGLPF
jgi:hypothetical protein